MHDNLLFSMYTVKKEMGETGMRDIPRPQEIYRHFKGNVYQIVAVATHTETDEELVIYQAMYGDFKIYARPLAMFLERVDRAKYPNASQEYRFEKMEVCAARADDEAQKSEPENVKVVAPETVEEETCEMQEEGCLDPLVAKFLDATKHEERLHIMSALHHRITANMLTTMAIAVGVELKSKDVEEQYEELKGCLITLERYEIKR